MKISFVSNYFNHHQKAFCDAMFLKTQEKFSFISTSEMKEERKVLGYVQDTLPSYCKTYKADANCQIIIDEADIVIVGSAPEELLKHRKKNKKVIFRYSERIYKRGIPLLKFPIHFLKMKNRYSRNSKQILLCASAFCSGDFAVTGNFVNNAYKWGYFPETIEYNLEELMKHKSKKKILWCGRFISWKHPEDAIEIAKRLKADGYSFELNLIGTGEIESALKREILNNGLKDNVCLLGSMSPAQVREHMKDAGIFLFTSDFQEGWGAVLNESMNSGCAVVASHAIGAVPYLIKHKENGLVYEYGSVCDLYNNVRYLLDNTEDQERIGRSAYRTIAELWNADVASTRFLKLAEDILDQGYCEMFEVGPCSRANTIKNNWFKG